MKRTLAVLALALMAGAGCSAQTTQHGHTTPTLPDLTKPGTLIVSTPDSNPTDCAITARNNAAPGPDLVWHADGSFAAGHHFGWRMDGTTCVVEFR